MGEYATRKSDNKPIKIGTCEDMLYSATRTETKLRAKKEAASATDGAFLFHGRTTSNLANTTIPTSVVRVEFLWTGRHPLETTAKKKSSSTSQSLLC